ncbi:MAG: lipopolysaccharide biosynthesis protein [Gemmatimonadaceae bacterium]
MNSSSESSVAAELIRTPPAVAAPPTAEVNRALVHGIAWTAGGKWATQLISWASTIIVARLLTPNDYGLVGMAAIYLGLVAVVSEFGIGAAIITLQDLSDEAIAQLNSLSVFVGFAIFVLSCAAAYPLSLFFRTPSLTPVVLVLSVSFIVGAFRSVPNALIQRRFGFRDLAAIDALRAMSAAIIAVVLATLGFRYWALVLSEVVGVAIATVLTVIRRPQGFAVPRFAAIEAAVTYSRRVLVGRLSWFVYSNSDFLVAGRVLGQAALGSYDFAWTLTNIPIEKVTSLISGVTPAIFASVQKDKEALKGYILSLTEAISLLAFPASIGIALVAGDLIHGVFGDKWAGAVAPLRMLALYATLRCIMPILPPALNVCGKTRFLMYPGLASAVVFPLAFWIGSHRGTIGIATVWVIL